MSRSFKHKPFMAITGGSSAQRDKTIASRSVRRTHSKLLHIITKNGDFEDFILPTRKECPNNDVWGWSRDGNQHYQGLSARDWSEYYKAIFDPNDIWYGDERHAVWPPAWYTEMTRK